MPDSCNTITEILELWLEEQGWEEKPELNEQGSITKFRFAVGGKYGLNCFFSVDEKLQMFTLVATPDFTIPEHKTSVIGEFCESKRMDGGVFTIGENGELFYINSVCFEDRTFTGKDVSIILKNMCDYVENVAEDIVILANN